MIYLDYAATTPVKKEVLEIFNKICLEFPGNANSIHSLGIKSKELLLHATKSIEEELNITSGNIIYTSGATESNNVALFGVIKKYSNRGNHLITTALEHPSILVPFSYLSKNGYVVSYAKVSENGVDLEEVEKLITDKTIFVSVCLVNSEIGIINNVKKLSEILKKYPKIIFHCDVTQAIGKIDVDFSLFDLASFSSHKFYGLKGIGGLYIRNNLDIEPLIYGGKSASVYRSGTPPLPLVVSMAKAIKLAKEDTSYVLKLNKLLVEELRNMDVIINSNELCSPYIVNVSILSIKPETLIHYLEKNNIFVSTKTACSSSDISSSLLAIGKSREVAGHSIRISLSSETKVEEIETFLNVLKNILEKELT